MTQDADGKPGAGSVDDKGTDDPGTDEARTNDKGTNDKGIDQRTDEAGEVTPEPSDVPSAAASTLGTDEPVEEPAPIKKSSTDAPAGTPDPDDDADFGAPGPPINRNGPFYIGFVGAIGVLLAWNLLKLIASLSAVLTLVGVAAFLAIGLDPLVRGLQRRGLGRGWAVAVVFVGVLAVFGGFIAAIVPTVISHAGELTDSLPDTLDNLRRSSVIHKLDADYGIITNASDQLRKKLSDGATVMSLFGGVLGASKAVLSGFVSTFTVLVLTLYFLASLHSIAEAGYRMVPASRRPRVRALGDEIIRRIGGYVAGQVAVATINGLLTFILLTILGVPYSIVLSITVAILGIIPLVGATLGAVIVVLVGLFQSWQIGVAIAVYYLLYQQIENYVIAPRIMARTVSVPGAVALIAALAGAALLGVLGALIAIPIAAAILLVIQEVTIPRQEQA
jgi:predicted PurR-regulated permease PerM